MDGCGHVAKPPWVSISLSVDWGFCGGQAVRIQQGPGQCLTHSLAGSPHCCTWDLKKKTRPKTLLGFIYQRALYPQWQWRKRNRKRWQKKRLCLLGTEKNIFCTLPGSPGTVNVHLGTHFSLSWALGYYPTMPTFRIPEHLHEMDSQLMNLF